MTPGMNILALAQTVTATQPVSWRAWQSRSPNAAGDLVDVYAAAQALTDTSVQAVNKKLYQTLGLDFARSYVTVLTSHDIKATARDRSGDVIIWQGRYWRCESDADWRPIDGWRRMLCVEVPAP